MGLDFVNPLATALHETPFLDFEWIAQLYLNIKVEGNNLIAPV